MPQTKYSISIKPFSNGTHFIHKEECPFLPDPAKRISLGVFSQTCSAVNEGNRYFSNVSCCPFCLKTHSSQKGYLSCSGIPFERNQNQLHPLKTIWESSLMGVN